MHKKIILLILSLIFIISCSSPSNPDNGNEGNNGGSTVPPPTGPTEEELIKKYGIDIGQEDTVISQKIEENLKAYYTEMGSYRVILTGIPKDYNTDKRLSTLILEAAEKNNINNIDVDIRNIDFQNGTINEYMFGLEPNETIFLNFIFPKDKIKIIKTMSFYNLLSLKNITIPNSVQLIEKEAFANCHQLEKLVFEEGITTIWNSSFPAAERLKELVLPSTIISIEDMALMNIGLTELTIPTSVTSIGTYAFASSINLTTITIPASVNTMGNSVFEGCYNLNTVTYLGTTPNDITSTGTDVFKDCSMLTTLIVPNATNPNDEKWKTFLGGNFTIVKQN